MPIITVDLWAGRTVEQKRLLVKELTDAYVRAAGGSPGAVQVVLRDVPKENWAVGGQLYSDRDGA
ncbi:4-oxalocrotonate tautomerase [Actinomadura scrupuli]|uniref:4-oxalocrotonate tautomerase n=1 Tax=Actinomadura scrupuli TaxID=559629 RepID=UPI003D990571